MFILPNIEKYETNISYSVFCFNRDESVNGTLTYAKSFWDNGYKIRRDWFDIGMNLYQIYI